MIVLSLICALAAVCSTRTLRPSVQIPFMPHMPNLELTIQGRYENTSIYGNRPVHGSPITNDGHAVESFIGIPYAEKPIGNLRFSKVPMKQANVFTFKTSIYDATTWSPGCMADFGIFTQETSDFSEDCLYLNVFRRKGTKMGDNKPVVFILHGGGYSAGDGHETDWRGNQLAYFGDAVVVSINYRLGIFGFLDFDLRGKADGNMGHHDQVQALRWVNHYISYFGGNPDRVTLFGVSAGSFSISFHLLTGDAQNLFHAAVMDAGVLTFFHAESSEQQWGRMTNFTQLTGCKQATSREQQLDCLRSLNATHLLNLQTDNWSVSQTYTFRPTYHSADLDQQPEYYINRRLFAHKVPLIIGDTTNEGLFLMTVKTHDLPPNLRSSQEVLNWTRMILKGHHAVDAPIKNDTIIMDVYGIVDPSTTKQYDSDSAQIIGDGLFVCPVMHFAEQYRDDLTPVYFYRWDRIRVKETTPGERDLGAYHGLMFYHGSGSQYLYLEGNLPDPDANYIFWTIGMIRDLARHPSLVPKFNTQEMANFRDGSVNNFVNEERNVLNQHPKVPVCRAVWNVFVQIFDLQL